MAQPNDYLNSGVIAAFVTGLFGLGAPLTAFFLSRKKSHRKNKKSISELQANRDKLNVPGYEALVTQMDSAFKGINLMKDAEIQRLTEALELRDRAAASREILIDTLRKELDACYEAIRKKDVEISQIRHLREYQEHASGIIKKDNTK